MHKEDGSPSRSRTRSGIDDIEAVGFHVIEGGLDIGDTEGDMRESAAAAVTFDQLCDRGGIRERLEQLDQVGSAADFQENFADLVGSEHLFAMNFTKPKFLVSSDLRVHFTAPHGHGNVIYEEELRERAHAILSTIYRMPNGKPLPIA